MNLGLSDKVAFVAGSSSGLGFAVARELLAEGCRVALSSRDRGRLEAAASRIVDQMHVDGLEERIHLVPCDVRDESHIRDALQSTVDQFGDLHLLVTNAGGPPTGQIDDLDSSTWREGIELNLMSTINTCRLALPHIRRSSGKMDGFGRILMISSISAKQPVPSLYLSNVSRAGVQGFAKSLSEEIGVEGITVNTILPGYTRTDRLAHLSVSLSERNGVSIDEVEAGWASTSALKRIGTEEEFAAAAVFLLSERASFITGVALSVDGGAVKFLL